MQSSGTVGAATTRSEKSAILKKTCSPSWVWRDIGKIEAVELLAVVRRVEERGALDVAHRVLTTAGQVWRYAVATGKAQRDVSADIRGALKPHHGKHFAAITDPQKLGQLIRVIRGYQGGPIVRAALQLAPMLFQRPGELRAAAWAEIDLDAAMWTIPSARMKRSVEGKRQRRPPRSSTANPSRRDFAQTAPNYRTQCVVFLR